MNALLDRDFCAALVLSFGHFLWQGTLVAGVGALIVRRRTTSPGRYRTLVATLVFMALCPWLTVAILVERNSGQQQTAPMQPVMANQPIVDAVPSEPVGSDAQMPRPAEVALLPQAVESMPAVSVAESSPAEEPQPPSDLWRQYAPAVMNLYLAVVALMLLRLLIGLWDGRQLRRKAIPVTDISLLVALRRQADALGMKLVPLLAYCERVAVPTVIGILKPTILLPLALTSGLAPDQVESVLAHELAHLRRYDHLVNLVQRVIESLLFFHPAVWWISHRVRIEREHCCDDLVIACGAVPLDYANSLLRVAELSRGANLSRSVAAVSLLATGKPSTLRQRIMRLLGDSTETPIRLSPRVLLATSSVLLLGLLLAIRMSNASAPPKGLEFLKPYPRVHGLSLDMTEPQFLEIIKQQELKTKKTVDGDKVTHHIALGDDHTLIVMFDKDGTCSGIQRVRGEDTPRVGQQPAQSKQQPDKSDQERMVGNWFIMNDDSLRKGEMWVIGEDRILMYAKHAGANANLYHHRLDAGKDPKQIDITVTLVKGPLVGVIKGIYVLDGDELRLCLGALGKDRPAAFPQKPGPGEVLILHRATSGASPPKAKEAQPDKTDQERIVGAPPELRTMREPAFRLPGHSNITGIGFDNNSTELVAVSTYHFATIRRWDLVGMKLKSDITLSSDRHLRPFREGSFKLSGDGRRVIAATDDFVGIWNTSTGELLKILPFPTREGIYDCGIDKLDCTSDLSVIAGHWAMFGRLTLAYDAHVMIWDGDSGKLLQTVIDKNATDLKSIDLSSDGKLLATTSGGGAKVWEVKSGKLLRSFPNDNSGRKHSDPEVSNDTTGHVWCVQLSPDGKQVAMGDILGVKLLDVASGKLLQLLEGPHRYGLGTLVFSKDGRLLARTGTGDRAEGNKTSYVVPIWSTQTGEKLFELYTESGSGAFSDDNKQFAVGVSDWEMALAVFQLSGSVANTTQLPPESTKDKVGGVGTHYRGKEAEQFIDNWKPVWGEPQLGIRYGIALTTPQRQFQIGERVPLVVFFRNASNKPLKVDTRPDFFGKTPKVVDAKGATVAFEKIPLLGGSTSRYVENLEPGEAVGPLYLNFGLGENPRPNQQTWTPYWKTPAAGSYKLTHSVSIKVAGPEAKPDVASNEWKGGDLASGTIEFEIADVVKPENKKEEPPEPNAVRERSSPLEFRVAVNPADGDAGPRVPADFLKRHYPDNTPAGRAAAKDGGFIWIPVAKPRDGGVILPVEASRGQVRLALLGDTTDTAFLLDGERRIVKCEAVRDQNQPDQRSIQVTLDEPAGAALQRLTKAHLNQKLAVVVEGKIIAAPTIRSVVGTDVMITGNFSRDEADKLVAAILSRNEPGDKPKPTGEGRKTENKQEESQKPNASAELSGRLYVNAGLRTTKDETRFSQSAIAIDPNTGSWTRLQEVSKSGFTVPLSQVRVSPDGRTMLFMREKELWKCDAMTGERTERVLEKGSPAAWAPDGRTFIAVVETNERDAQFVENWIVSTDGQKQSVIALPKGDAVEDWSADGQWLAVRSRLDSQIYLVKPDGSGRRRLATSIEYALGHSSFSPDSRRIVYLSRQTLDDKSHFSLRTINVDGTGDREILGEKKAGSQPDSAVWTAPMAARWSPNGKHLAVVLFDHTRDGGILAINGNWRLAFIDADGGNLRELKLEGMLNTVLPWDGPEWRPIAPGRLPGAEPPSPPPGAAASSSKTQPESTPPSSQTKVAQADKEPSATAVGTVVAPDNKPVAGIEVLVFQGGKQLEQKFTTDKKGEFRVPKAWREVDHWLTVVARDGRQRLGWFDFMIHGRSDIGQKSEDGSFRLVLLPMSRTVRGRVLDESGRPLAQIPVRINQLDHEVNSTAVHWRYQKLGGEALVLGAVTDNDGRFELRLPANTFAWLGTSHPDWVEQRIRATKEKDDVGDTRLVRAAKVAGRVIDSRTGTPLAGVTIAAHATKTEILESGGDEAKTDAEGNYLIQGLRSGEYAIQLEEGADKTLTAPAFAKALLKSGETFQADFSLSVGKRLAGRVLDMDTGEPIPSCKVTYTGPARPRDGLSIETNQRGEFEFFVPPGRSSLDATEGRRFGNDSTRKVDVPADGDPEPVVLKVGEETESVPGSFKIFIGLPLDRKVSLHFQRAPLVEVLESVCQAAAVKLELDGDGLKSVGYTKNMPVTIDSENVMLRDALTQVLKPYDKLAFTLDKDQIFVSTRPQVEARDKANSQTEATTERQSAKPQDGTKGDSRSEIRRGQNALDRAKQINPTWGEAKDGLQIGLARLGDKPRFRPGERVPLEIYIRNVGQQSVVARFTAEFYSDVPTVRDPNGKEVTIEPLILLGARARYKETLKPGEVVVYPHWGLGIGTTRPADYNTIWNPFIAAPITGTYTVAQSLHLTITPDGSDASQNLQLSSGLVKFEVEAAQKTQSPETSAVQSREIAPVAWGKELNGLRTRVTLLTEKPAVGQPLRVKIELQNIGKVERAYQSQRADPDYLLDVVGPDGKPAEFIKGGSGIPVQTLKIKPDETVVLWEDVDVASMFLLANPGRYEIKLRGPDRFDVDAAGPERAHPNPASNTLAVTLAEGTLNDIQATFVRIRNIAPKDWNISTRGNVISNIQKSITRRAEFLLLFTKERQADDQKFGTMSYEYLGPTRLGHAYLAVNPLAKTEWPECVEKIREQLPPADTVTGEWGKELSGLRTRVTLLTEKPAVGQPLQVKIELQNVGQVERKYQSQRANPDYRLEIVGPDGKPAEFINGPLQVQVGSATIEPGETVVLWDAIDVASMFLLPKPGRYEVKLRGPDRLDGDEADPERVHLHPTSNTLSVTLAEGTLNDIQATFVGVRNIAPKGWQVSTRDTSIVLTSPNFQKGGVGRGIIHLVFVKERKTDEQKLLGVVQYEELGLTTLGHAYVAASPETRTEWPGCVERIRELLPSKSR